jgi:thioredoxin 1
MKGALPMSDNLLEFSDANFEKEVLRSDTPVLVDFWAPWCGPCRMIAPVVEQIANDFAGRIKVGKLNTDDNGGISERYDIRSIPTLVLFKNGQVADRKIGALPKKELETLLNAHV